MVMGKWWVGHIDDQASRYDWVVFGRYLLGWLINMKMKLRLLFDVSNTCIPIVANIFIWAL